MPCYFPVGRLPKYDERVLYYFCMYYIVLLMHPNDLQRLTLKVSSIVHPAWFNARAVVLGENTSPLAAASRLLVILPPCKIRDESDP